jgi:hypothetical protein
MIEPNGPLPASVYWRRRAVAAGSSVLAVVVLAWVIGGVVGTADDEPVQAAGDLAAVPSSPPSRNPVAAATSSGALPVASPGPAPTGRPTTMAAVPSTTVPPGPPKACPDSVIRVGARSGATRYRLGERPSLRLLVVNAGAVPCVRDVSRKLRELLILSGDGRTRLWSSNDCYGPPGAERRVLRPGKPMVFELRWAGRTSAPGCPVRRATVPAGSYRLIGRLGQLAGPPIPLVLTP